MPGPSFDKATRVLFASISASVFLQRERKDYPTTIPKKEQVKVYRNRYHCYQTLQAILEKRLVLIAKNDSSVTVLWLAPRRKKPEVILHLKTKLDGVQCKIDERFFFLFLRPFLLMDEINTKGERMIVGHMAHWCQVQDCRISPVAILSFVPLEWGCFLRPGSCRVTQAGLALPALFPPHCTFVYGRRPWS